MSSLSLQLGLPKAPLRLGSLIPKPVLLIVAGQSNATASGTSGLTPPSRYGSLSQAKVWDGSTFVPYQPGVNAGVPAQPTAWGPEAEFAYRLAQRDPGRVIYIVKEAAGGTALQPGTGADWHPESGELFSTLATKVSAARSWISGEAVGGLDEITIWCQGEADMADNGFAAAYQLNFATLLEAWREAISPGLFIAERIRLPGHEPSRYANGYLVRQAQHAVIETDPSAVLVDLDFQEDGFAILHPGIDWVTGRGERAFAAWQKSYDAEYGSITAQTPNAFTLQPVTAADLASVVTSISITPTGFQKAAPVSVTGAEIQIAHPDGSVAVAWTSGPALIDKYQTFKLRLTTASTYETPSEATVAIGGVSASWSVTTRAESVGYETETQAFLDRMSAVGAPALSSADSAALDTFIAAAKSGGWWTDIGSAFLFGIPSSRTAARINLRSPANALATETGTLQWSATQGFDPNVVSDTHLDLQFNPSGHQNAVAIATWYSELTASVNFDFRSSAGSGNLFGIYVDNAGNWRFSLNNVTATRTGLSTQIGFRMAVRTGAAQVLFYGPAGSQIDEASNASGTPSGTDVKFGKSGTTANRSVAAALLFPNAPSATKALSIRNALNALGAAWGWPGAM